MSDIFSTLLSSWLGLVVFTGTMRMRLNGIWMIPKLSSILCIRFGIKHRGNGSVVSVSRVLVELLCQRNLKSSPLFTSTLFTSTISNVQEGIVLLKSGKQFWKKRRLKCSSFHFHSVNDCSWKEQLNVNRTWWDFLLPRRCISFKEFVTLNCLGFFYNEFFLFSFSSLWGIFVGRGGGRQCFWCWYWAGDGLNHFFSKRTFLLV